MKISAQSPGAFRLPPLPPLPQLHGLHTRLHCGRVLRSVALLTLLSIERSLSSSPANPRVSAPAVHEFRSDCSEHRGADAFGAEAQVALAGRATGAVAASGSASIRSSCVTRDGVAGLSNPRSPYVVTVVASAATSIYKILDPTIYKRRHPVAVPITCPYNLRIRSHPITHFLFRVLRYSVSSIRRTE